MLTRSITLFKLLGFDIKIDLTWIFLAVLITWSLAVNVFPYQFEGLSPTVYWLMGAEGAFGLFASIVLHELGHSLVARRYGIQMRGITLFIFGGVADMATEPQRPRDEFYMALAGPLTSMLLAGVFWAGSELGALAIGDTPFLSVIRYLALMNLILAIFNMVPAFPLDGGRVLRAILWEWKGDVRWATRISAGLGSSFGILLIALGVLSLVVGNLIAGVWWVMIGLFVRSASAMSYKHVLLRSALEGESVRRFMQTAVISVPPDLSVHNIVEDYVYRHHFKTYPVQENGQLLGAVTTRAIKNLPREEWDQRTAREIMLPCNDDICIDADADAMDAFTTMNRTGNARLLVLEDGRLAGIVALKDLMEFLALKMDLETK